MRLRKPNLIAQVVPTLTAPQFLSSPLSNLADASIIDPLLDGNTLTDLAALPNGFGSMFVGTHFLAYVCLNNESSTPVTNVEINAELRTSTGKSALTPILTRLGTNEPTSETTFTLSPNEALHQILDHSTFPFLLQQFHSFLSYEILMHLVFRSHDQRRSYIRSRHNLHAFHRGRSTPHLPKNVQLHHIRHNSSSLHVTPLSNSPPLRTFSNAHRKYRKRTIHPNFIELPY